MKLSKGFVWLPLLLVILGVLIIGGGAYVAMHQTTAPQEPIYQLATSTPATTQATTNTTTGQSGSSSSFATIDQGSLSTVAGNITLTGSANVPSLSIAVSASDGTLAYSNGARNPIPVSNSRWSVNIGNLQNLGQYTIQVYNYDPYTLLVTKTLTVGASSQSSISVSGMSQYTDADFGFSFWYPSSWKVGTVPDKSGVSLQTIVLSNSAGQTMLNIDEYRTRYLDFPEDQGTTERFYFDASAHTWMHGVVGAYLQPADVSLNSMGGLHIIARSAVSLNAKVLPLSASTFVQVVGIAPQINILPFANTIVATDASVATPASAAQQTATIQAEAAAYAGQ